jgi:hypothetical protein
MATSPVNPSAAVELTLGAFEKLVLYFVRRGDEKRLKAQIQAVWYELLKGDAADDAVIQSALAAARSASDAAADRVRLESLFRSPGSLPKGKTAKRTASTHGKKKKATRRTAK